MDNNSNNPSSVLALVHDLQIFVDIFREKGDEESQFRDELMKKYKAVRRFGDEEEYQIVFELHGERYVWDFGEEILYRNSFEEGEPITSGSAFELATAYDASIRAVYHAVETEMESRGWYCDPDEYHYNLFKGGWSCEMSYFPRSIDDVDQFEYEPDEPGYYCHRPFRYIVQYVLFQIKRDNNLLPSFKLSDLEGGQSP